VIAFYNRGNAFYDKGEYDRATTEFERMVDALLDEYRGRSLNNQPAFAGLNPSLEHFSRILCQSLAPSLNGQQIAAITVRLWEDDAAWASFRTSHP